MKEPLISIIVPVFNAEKTIARCLNSILSQTYKKIEVVVIVQKSKDNSLKIVKSISSKDTRIRLFETPEYSGVSYNRNIGLKNVLGSLAMFVDSDDYLISKTSVSIMIHSSSNNDFLCANRKDSNGYVYHNQKSSTLLFLTNDIANNNPLWYWLTDTVQGKLYKIDIIKNNRIKFPEQISIAEDNFFNYIYISKITRFKLINDVVYCNDLTNIHSLSRGYRPSIIDELMIMVSILKENINEFFYKKIWIATYWDINTFLRREINLKISYKSIKKDIKKFSLFAKKEKCIFSSVCSKRKILLKLNLFMFYYLSLKLLPSSNK